MNKRISVINICTGNYCVLCAHQVAHTNITSTIPFFSMGIFLYWDEYRGITYGSDMLLNTVGGSQSIAALITCHSEIIIVASKWKVLSSFWRAKIAFQCYFWITQMELSKSLQPCGETDFLYNIRTHYFPHCSKCMLRNEHSPRICLELCDPLIIKEW